jgi:hypothetical protein
MSSEGAEHACIRPLSIANKLLLKLTTAAHPRQSLPFRITTGKFGTQSVAFVMTASHQLVLHYSALPRCAVQDRTVISGPRCRRHEDHVSDHVLAHGNLPFSLTSHELRPEHSMAFVD